AVCYRFLQGLRSVQDEERGMIEHETPSGKILKESFADIRVLCCPFPEPQNMLLSSQIHTQNANDHLSIQRRPVNDQDANIECGEISFTHGLQICLGRFDDLTADDTL